LKQIFEFSAQEAPARTDVLLIDTSVTATTATTKKVTVADLVRDMHGDELILDADNDTSITADTDDQIDIKIAGADDFRFTPNTFTILSGSTLALATGSAITIAAGVELPTYVMAGSLDLNGQSLLLDPAGTSSISAAVDGTINIVVAGATDFTITANTLTVPNGSTIVFSATSTLDMNGQELILDADGNTSITADTNDQIDIRVGGADDFRFTPNVFLVLNGSSVVFNVTSTLDMNGQKIILDANADTSLHADTDNQIDIEIGGADDFRFTANNFVVLAGSTIDASLGALRLPAPVAKTSAYTVTSADFGKVITLNKATADTLTLPALSSSIDGAIIGINNANAGTWTIDPNGAETITSFGTARTTISVYSGETFWLIADNANSTWRTVGRARQVLAETKTASGSATLDLEEAFSDPEVRQHSFEFRNTLPATDGAIPWVRLKDSTYQADATDYEYTTANALSNAAPWGTGVASQGAAQIVLGGGQGNVSGEGCSGAVTLHGADVAGANRVVWQLSYWTDDATSLLRFSTGAGSYNGASATVTGLRFMMSAGNIASGSIDHWILR